MFIKDFLCLFFSNVLLNDSVFNVGGKQDFSEIKPFIVMFTYTTNGIQTKQERNLIMVLVMRRLFMRSDFV